jgi:DNA replication and repair protein RecF
VSNTKLFAITRLTLTNFRNYEALRLEPGLGFVVLTGPNGAGKTNLLEAISLLSPGRGLRGEEFQVLARNHTARQWAVAAETILPTGPQQLGTAWGMADAEDDMMPTTRSSMVDGIPHKTVGALAGQLRLLWLTPAMDRLFSGSPGERRRFFDRLVGLFDHEHAARVNRFDKLLRERNKVLQDQHSDAVWLSSLEAQMAEYAVAIAAARSNAVGIIARYFDRSSTDGPFPWGRVTALGELELLAAHMTSVRVEDDYRRILHDGRGLDRSAGRCLRGPHRSDFEVVHGPKDMVAEACSTGEQKALLLGLILAQAEAAKAVLGAAPLLLLDEVTAHLDKARRHGLFGLLQRLGGQVWMTGTDAVLFDGIAAAAVVYRVENGHISESKTSPSLTS